MSTKTPKTSGWGGLSAPALALLCALWACGDPRPEDGGSGGAGAERPTGGSPPPPEQGDRPGGSFTDTARWGGSVAASFTDAGSVAADFRYEAAQLVRISVIRFRLTQPAEVLVSHCGSDLPGTTLLLVDSLRQAVSSPGKGGLPVASCGNPALGQLRVAAQEGVYYAVGCASGTVQVDVSRLLGVASPAIISMQTSAVTGTLRTGIACSPLAGGALSQASKTKKMSKQ